MVTNSFIHPQTLEASKWLSCQVLLDPFEMNKLFKELGDFFILVTGSVTKSGEESLTKNEFLQIYDTYISCLQESTLPDLEKFRKPFSTSFSAQEDHVHKILLGEDRHLLRVVRPVIQLQAHQIGYSVEEKKFRPMMLGSDCITWGLQFSFPQIIEDASTKEVRTTKSDPNYPLFRCIQRWVRHHTIPTPFVVGDQSINVPMRLGKLCLPWINNHPQLQKQKILVKSD